MLWAFRAAFQQHAVPSALNAQVFNARPKPQVEFLTSTSSAVKQGLPEAISSPAIPRRGNSCQKACSQRCTAIMLAANVDATSATKPPVMDATLASANLGRRHRRRRRRRRRRRQKAFHHQENAGTPSPLASRSSIRQPSPELGTRSIFQTHLGLGGIRSEKCVA